jgi:SAM-dependent methyltransferase
MAIKRLYETIEECRVCHSANIQEVLNLGKQPPANSLYRLNDDYPEDVPLRLVYCHKCSTVQLGEDVNPEYLFGSYLWITGTSNVAAQYSYKFVKKALSELIDSNIKKPYVIEIASNDGTFLKRFLENGCKVLGVDPAKNIAELAVENGIPTRNDFFTIELANILLNENGKSDIIFARNVIPHVKEIHSVISGMSTLLKANGVGIIEFHNAELVLEELHYDYIYHEHLFYYTLKTISGLIERYDLYIYDVMPSPISGGSWVVYFSKTKKQKSLKLLDVEQCELKNKTNSYKSWESFSEKVNQHARKLREMVIHEDKKILAYGASARSSTLLNFCRITSKHISSVIDKNPLKKGLMTAGSNIPIISFEEGLKDIQDAEKILLLAWNFQDEIVKDLRESGFKGEFIIPLPGDPYIL